MPWAWIKPLQDKTPALRAACEYTTKRADNAAPIASKTAKTPSTVLGATQVAAWAASANGLPVTEP